MFWLDASHRARPLWRESLCLVVPEYLGVLRRRIRGNQRLPQPGPSSLRLPFARLHSLSRWCLPTGIWIRSLDNSPQCNNSDLVLFPRRRVPARHRSHNVRPFHQAPPIEAGKYFRWNMPPARGCEQRFFSLQLKSSPYVRKDVASKCQ